MNQPYLKAHLQQIFQSFSKQLKMVFADMDRAYQSAAAVYAFSCDGCKDNCCRSLFYHHTFLEYCFLLDGFAGLSSVKQREIICRAREKGQMSGELNPNNQANRPMCPLNSKGRCMLYANRPMICRLHGIPHEFRPPGKGTVNGAGCRTFEDRCGQKQYYPFDRTPFYARMAALEKAFKQQAGVGHKLKLTVAEIICSFEK